MSFSMFSPANLRSCFSGLLPQYGNRYFFNRVVRGFSKQSASSFSTSAPTSVASSSYSSVSLIRAFASAAKYRFGRYYYSFFYSQYTNKYVLVILAPAFFFAVRFKHDTTLGYHIYMDAPPSDTLGSTTSYQAFADANTAETHSHSNSSTAETNNYNNNNNTISATSLPKSKLASIMSGTFSNGTKVYMDDKATVKNLKEKVFEFSDETKELEINKIQTSCHGRLLEDEDLLAFAVRAYCKRDPKIYFSKIIE